MSTSASVIVPVHNGEAVITDQLTALHHQTCRSNLEIIVVDDASRDATADVVESWIHATGAPACRLVRRRQRGGPNASRNLGLSLASFDLVLFCDGDDVVDERWAEAMIKARRPGTILGGRYLRLGGDPSNPDDWVLQTAKLLGWEYAFGGNLGVERSLALSIGGFDESITLGGTEAEFCIRAQLMANATVARVEDAVVNYRMAEVPTHRFSRAFRRERGHAYIERRHREHSRTRPFKVHVKAAKRVARSLWSRAVRRPFQGDFSTELGRFLGLAWWRLVFRIREPQPRLMTTTRGDHSE